MKQPCIRADSFVLKSRRIRIYRVRQRGTSTVLWTSADAALRYLTILQIQQLQAKHKGR
jgi:hypothetical protein